MLTAARVVIATQNIWIYFIYILVSRGFHFESAWIKIIMISYENLNDIYLREHLLQSVILTFSRFC